LVPRAVPWASKLCRPFGPKTMTGAASPSEIAHVKKEWWLGTSYQRAAGIPVGHKAHVVATLWHDTPGRETTEPVRAALEFDGIPNE